MNKKTQVLESLHLCFVVPTGLKEMLSYEIIEIT
nr:MAG TPA: hypothetical protein [Bacteriophage sp.]